MTDDLPGIGGSIRAAPDDFVVEEVPAYEPSGSGGHTFLFIEKVDLTTPEAVRRIAAAVGGDPDAAGVAGMKDRHARTRQWISLEGVDPERAAGLEVDGAKVLAAARHPHRLRTGHLRANRFEIRIRDVTAADAAARARTVLDRLSTTGAPGYFGPQRFGRDGTGGDVAREWLAGRTRPPTDRRARRLAASAWQSALFNEVCARRVRLQPWMCALAGDLCRKEDTGGLFVERDLAVLQPRVDAAEVSPTGPLFGHKMRAPEADAAAIERDVLATDGDAETILSRWAKLVPGGRRPLRHFPRDVSIRDEPGALVLAFTLPSGAFATVVLDEVMKANQGGS